MSEPKADRFKRLAEKRVNRVIRDMRLVGNLANRNNYAYTPEQVGRILAALKKELGELRDKFERKGAADDLLFEL